jgi:hypothetical protein
MKKNFFYLFLAIFATVLLGSCRQDDVEPQDDDFTGRSETYAIYEPGTLNAIGEAVIRERTDGTTEIAVSVNNLTGNNPVYIRENNFLEGGDIVASLEPLSNGSSTTILSTREDGTTINYDDLIGMSAHINVYEDHDDDEDDNGTAHVIAQGDIGVNALTGESQEIVLTEINESGVNGTATIYQRANNEALVYIVVEGTSEGMWHPANLYRYEHNEDTEAAEPVFWTALNPVQGVTGTSLTNLGMDGQGNAQTYDEVIQEHGLIQVYESEDALNPVASGEWGADAA